MIRTGFATLALALCTPAFAQTTTMAQPYLEAGARGDIFEITTSQIALMKSQDQDVKDFAMRMISDHTRATNQALEAAKDASVLPPPAVLNEQQRQQITQLLNAFGAQFDRLFWQTQVDAHTRALDLHRTYAQRGDTPRLRTFAARIAPPVENHLETARRQAAM